MNIPIINDNPEHNKQVSEARRTLPVVSADQFEALHLFAHHYETLGRLLDDFTAQEIRELVMNGYQTTAINGLRPIHLRWKV